MPERREQLFHKDQHVLCKFAGGRNGDLIVGRIKSVRRDGDITLVNLLSGETATKKTEVLSVRNVRVHKKYALEVVKFWKEHDNNRALTRQYAVALVRRLARPAPAPVEAPAAAATPVTTPPPRLNGSRTRRPLGTPSLSAPLSANTVMAQLDRLPEPEQELFARAITKVILDRAFPKES